MASFATKDAAEAHLAAVDVARRTGAPVAASTIRVEDWVRTWTARQVHHRASTAAQVEQHMRRHVLPVIGASRVGQVTRGDIQDMIAGWAGVLAPATQRVVYAYVTSVFASAVHERIIVATPCQRIRLPRVPKELVKPMSVEQVQALAGHMTPRLRGAVWLAAGTGLRPGEWRALTEDRVDLEAGVVRVDRQIASARDGIVWGPTKTPSSVRAVTLAPVTVEALRGHMAEHPRGPHGLVFRSRLGAALSRSSVSEAWQSAAGRAELVLPERSGWHDLRHHHASLLISAGLSPRAVADRLGHSTPVETLERYAHLWPGDDERARAAVESAYFRES